MTFSLTSSDEIHERGTFADAVDAMQISTEVAARVGES